MLWENPYVRITGPHPEYEHAASPDIPLQELGMGRSGYPPLDSSGSYFGQLHTPRFSEGAGWSGGTVHGGVGARNNGGKHPNRWNAVVDASLQGNVLRDHQTRVRVGHIGEEVAAAAAAAAAAINPEIAPPVGGTGEAATPADPPTPSALSSPRPQATMTPPPPPPSLPLPAKTAKRISLRSKSSTALPTITDPKENREQSPSPGRTRTYSVTTAALAAMTSQTDSGSSRKRPEQRFTSPLRNGSRVSTLQEESGDTDDEQRTTADGMLPEGQSLLSTEVRAADQVGFKTDNETDVTSVKAHYPPPPLPQIPAVVMSKSFVGSMTAPIPISSRRLGPRPHPNTTANSPSQALRARNKTPLLSLFTEATGEGTSPAHDTPGSGKPSARRTAEIPEATAGGTIMLKRSVTLPTKRPGAQRKGGGWGSQLTGPAGENEDAGAKLRPDGNDDKMTICLNPWRPVMLRPKSMFTGITVFPTQQDDNQPQRSLSYEEGHMSDVEIDIEDEDASSTSRLLLNELGTEDDGLSGLAGRKVVRPSVLSRTNSQHQDHLMGRKPTGDGRRANGNEPGQPMEKGIDTSFWEDGCDGWPKESDLWIPTEPQETSALAMLLRQRKEMVTNVFASEFSSYGSTAANDANCMELKVFLPELLGQPDSLTVNVRKTATVEQCIGFILFQY
ncbi:hypothetical protein EV182_003368, partial [Spiromyces aspiralis]